MPKIQTLGPGRKRTWFKYEGSANSGTILLFQSGKVSVPHQLYMAALRHFSGKTVRGGFSMTNPTLGGFGEWIEKNSSKYGCSLTPRHGSFIAAILVHEGYIQSSLRGNAVILHFLQVHHVHEA